MTRLFLSLVLGLAIVLTAFSLKVGGDEPNLPATPYNYAAIPLPTYLVNSGIGSLDNTPDDNPITDAGATLGRVLFYDTRLSANGTVSCASCHPQENAFADPVPLSTGFDGESTTRNAMGLTFVRYFPRRRMFWDERSPTLEHQVLLPIEDPVEMGTTLGEVMARLEGTSFYPGLFAEAFGSAEITEERISRALSQFIRSIVTPRSRYDMAREAQGGLPGPDPLPGFTEAENLGLEIFFTEVCRQCHGSDLFIGEEPRNNGLDPVTIDPGAGGARFKAPSLRNIALTAPYMHDGRFATLGEVVDHYSTGIQPHPNLDNRLRDRDGPPIRFNFTPEERAGLIAFLETLTDTEATTDPRWSDPFDASTATEPPDTRPDTRIVSVSPNPAIAEATLRIRLDQSQAVEIAVFDITGRRVALLADETWSAGTRAVRWSTGRVPPGIYFVRLTTPEGVFTRSVTVLR